MFKKKTKKKEEELEFEEEPEEETEEEEEEEEETPKKKLPKVPKQDQPKPLTPNEVLTVAEDHIIRATELIRYARSLK